MTLATNKPVVPGAGLNWDATSLDYALHRPGYPASFFDKALKAGVGLPAQRILDLGAGTGALALQFARQGSQVVALDASEGQLKSLKEKADKEHLDLGILHARAEETGLPPADFDAITASMCWGYFDRESMAREIPRLLRPKGLLLVSSLIWTHDDPVSKITDDLIARYNPASTRGKQAHQTSAIPDWVAPPFTFRRFHSWIEGLQFTREGWCGRIRASKWIGAALDRDMVEAFDREHDDKLRSIAPDRFIVPHRITLHILGVDN